MLNRIVFKVNIEKILRSLVLKDPEPIIKIASVKFVVLLQSIWSCPVKLGRKTAAISLARIVELRETKEPKAMSEALENHLNDYSVVGEIGIICVSTYVVAITFVTVKEEIETEIEAVET